MIDLVFVAKDADGDVVGIELSDLDEATSAAFRPHVEEPSGMLSDEDIEDLGAELEPNSSAAILLFEHVWATRFRDAVVDSGGELVASIRIPKEVVDEVRRRGLIEPRHPSTRHPATRGARDASTRKAHSADRGDRRHGQRGRRRRLAPPAAEVRRAGRRGAAAAAPRRSSRAAAAPRRPSPISTRSSPQLAQLHSQGILTDEEFSAKKAQLLGI